MNYNICWLRQQFSWMGKYSGYDQLFKQLDNLQATNTYQSLWQNKQTRLTKRLYWFVRRLSNNAEASPMYNLDNTIDELNLFFHNRKYRPNLTHISYVENQMGLLPKWRKYLSGKIIGTAHQPAGWWRLAHKHPEWIAALDGLIVVGSNQVDYFEQYLPGKVFYIPHGVDTDFFVPKENMKSSSCYRFLFSGKHLRDFETLSKIVNLVLMANPDIQFDILLPHLNRNWTNSILINLARHKQVFWHANLSDEDLRELYRNATAMLLPLLDCTANNALLEGLACGLPVITNELESLRNYTNATFAHLYPVGDVEGMSEAILKMVNNPNTIDGQKKSAREFVENNFNWIKVANRTLEAYNKILA